MANVLHKEKQLHVLRCLVEGNSIRSTERITGVYRNTVMRLLVSFGNDCHNWLNLALSNLSLEHVEIDELWGFVGKKDRMLTDTERRSGQLGSQYVYLGIDQDSKLIASYAIGKRTEGTTRAFVRDLEQRLVRRPSVDFSGNTQLSTDGFAAYPPAIGEAFGGTVRHGVLIKNYSNPEVGRYAPPDLSRAERINVNGISDTRTICTSHIERHNLTVRTFLKRFARLSLGFSKKLENMKAAVALHVAYYNFCWRLREPGKSGKLRPTPAMAAGLTGELWDIERLYDEVNAKTWRDEHSRRMERLLRAMARQ